MEMDYCELHRVEYSNSDDECPLCAREVDSVIEAASAEKSIDEVYYDRNRFRETASEKQGILGRSTADHPPNRGRFPPISRPSTEETFREPRKEEASHDD